MKKENNYDVVENIMSVVEAMNSEVKLISSEDAMKKLDGLSGIAAILRWKENYT